MKLKYFLFVSLFFISKCMSGINKVDSLIGICLGTKTNDTDRVKCIDLKSFEISNSDPRAGILLAKRALAISLKLKWEKGIALASNEMAVCYNILGKLDSAIIYYNQSLKFFSKIGNVNAQSSVLTNISQVYKSQGNYPKALKLLDRAYEIQVKNNMIHVQGITLENIGINYLELNDLEKSKKFFHLARVLYIRQEDSQSIVRNNINLGIIYDKFGQFDSALIYLNSALAYSMKHKRNTSLQNIYANLGLVYLHKNEFAKAIQTHNMALDLCLRLESENSLAIAYGNLGEVYLEKFKHHCIKSDLTYAVNYLKKAYFLCQTIGFVPPQIEFGEKLVEALDLQGNDYKLAYVVFNQLTQLRNSIYSKDNRIKILEIETKNEMEKKEKELKISRIENTLTKTENKKYKLQKTILILVTVIFGMAIFLLYLIYVNRDRLFKKRMQEISQIQSHQIRSPVVKILSITQAIRSKFTDKDELPVLLDMLEKSTMELDIRIHEIVEKTSE